jgi:hypothetical protein
MARASKKCGGSRAKARPQRRTASKADPKALGAKRKSDAAARRNAWAANHGSQAAQGHDQYFEYCEGDGQ